MCLHSKYGTFMAAVPSRKFLPDCGRATPGSLLKLGVIVPVFVWVVAAGCDDPFIDPFVEGRHFTVYGYLNESDNEHFVRVVAVRRFPEDIPRLSSPHAELDGRVTSTDLTTGEHHVWRHQLVELDDGNYGHVFRAAFIVRKGHEYQLVVTRSDGAQSRARTRVPRLSSWRTEEPVVQGDTTSQVLTWMGVSTPDEISVWYCARPVGALACQRVAVPYGRKGRRTEEGWAVNVELSRDLLFVRQTMGFGEDVVPELTFIEMRLTALDDQWVLPESPVDPNEFAQPGALSNVENGFGFWGSIAGSQASWVPDREVLAVSGYVPPSGSASDRSASSKSAHPMSTFHPPRSLVSR